MRRSTGGWLILGAWLAAAACDRATILPEEGEVRDLTLAFEASGEPGPGADVVVEFPDHPLLEGTGSFVLFVIQSTSYGCAEFLPADGAAPPSEDIVESARGDLPHPGALPALQAVPARVELVFAFELSRGGLVAARGCATAQVPALGAAGVRVVLSCRPTAEVPGNGLDDDCDGLIDECLDAADCDDGNGCTADSCGEDGLCDYAPEAYCDDGDPCTVDDACTLVAGTYACLGAPKCDDLDPCTVDACDPTSGACTNTLACDDANPCSQDSCAGDGSCSHSLAAGPCDDGDPCTRADACLEQAGAFVCQGEPKCVDQDPCTLDACDPLSGDCSYPAACDDGNGCSRDLCDAAGVCSYELEPGFCDDADPCTTEEACQEAAGAFVCLGRPLCDDGDPCTQDLCDAGVCQHTSGCDDGLFCNGQESCDPLTGACGPGVPLLCDDGDPCTRDSCQEASPRCLHDFDASLGTLEVCPDGIDQDCDGAVDDCCGPDGTFQPFVELFLKSNPNIGLQATSVAIADFDGDAIPDILVGGHGDAVDEGPRLLLGQGVDGHGNGTFQIQHLANLAGAHSDDLAVGDIDRDGDLDVVVTGAYDTTVRVLENPGDGALFLTSSVDLGNVEDDGHHMPLRLADLDGDHILDLVVGVNLVALGRHVLILRGGGADGVGDFTFAPFVPSPADRIAVLGFYFNGILVGDFDGDRIPDLAVSTAAPTDLCVFLGQGADGRGDGTFAPGWSATGWDVVGPLETVDIDRDGILDLVFQVSLGIDNLVAVSFGNGSEGQGDGTFADPVTTAAGETKASGAVVDLNGDRVMDFVFPCWDTDDCLAVFPGLGQDGRGDGRLGAVARFPISSITWTSASPRQVASGDLDADGLPDMVVANYSAKSVSVLFGRGLGGPASAELGALMPLEAGAGSTALVSADLDADGLSDLAAVVDGELRVRLAQGGGAFAAPWTLALDPAMRQLAVGDVDADAIPDLVVALPGEVRVLLGGGAGGWGDGTYAEQAGQAASADPTALAIADLDGDGILDLVQGDGQGQALVVLWGQGVDGRGDGTFGTPASFSLPAGCAPAALAVADQDEDGLPDLAAGCGAAGGVAVLLGQGGRAFAAPMASAAGGEVSALAPAGDMNADGIPDLVALRRFSEEVALLRGLGASGQGNGGFAVADAVPAGFVPEALVVRDLDRDGVSDAVVIGVNAQGAGRLLVLRGQGSGGHGSGALLAGTALDTVAGASQLAGVGLDGAGGLGFAVAGAGVGLHALDQTCDAVGR